MEDKTQAITIGNGGQLDIEKEAMIDGAVTVDEEEITENVGPRKSGRKRMLSRKARDV